MCFWLMMCMVRGIFCTLHIYLFDQTATLVKQNALLKMDVKLQFLKTMGVKFSFDINFECQSTNAPIF